MSLIRRISIVLTLLTGTLLLGACGGGSETFEWQPIFGDEGRDNSPVIARVGDIDVTQDDLDLRYDELPDQAKGRYQGEEGLRLLLMEMCNEITMVKAAVDLELYNERDVQRTLIANRRATMVRALRGLIIVGDKEPTDEEKQQYFKLNRDKYVVRGRINLRHIETLTRDDANAAFERLQSDLAVNDWAHVSNDYNINDTTRANDGILGWVNEGSFVPFIENSTEFTAAAWKLQAGINLPIQVGDHWHVVQVVDRQDDRPMTYQEAVGTVGEHMKASFQDQLTSNWLREARTKTPPEYMGRFAPGGGLDVEQIFARAMAIPAPHQKFDVFTLIINDFPESDRADDALFWKAQAAIDAWGDRVIAINTLAILVERYPDSEFVDDARYILENANDPKVWNPIGSSTP